MQFDTPSSYNNHKHHDSTMNAKTDYSMYLPGMGRIATTPIIITVQRKQVDDSNDLKKGTSTVSIEKPNIAIAKKPETKNVGNLDPAVESEFVSLVTEIIVEPPKIIYYRVWPGGPIKTFPTPIATATTHSAAIVLQKVVRGHCARTNSYVRKLERQVQAMNAQIVRDVHAIQADQEQEKVLVRRKVTQKQTSLLKVRLETKKTAEQGSELINYLRKENKKLRQKNEKIAASIRALRLQNEQLESLTNETGENQNLLGTHFDKIQETNTLLLSVVPQYESKIAELQGALDARQQYCDVETKMKVMYMKLIGTVTEMMEQDSNDPELIEEIMQFCADVPSDFIPSPIAPIDAASLSLDGDNKNDILESKDHENDDVNGDPTEYDEVSVLDNMGDQDHHDDDDSDSNNYDDYTIAGME